MIFKNSISLKRCNCRARMAQVLRDNIQYNFLQDGHFAELKESEMLMERLRLADSMRDYVGKYFSVEFVRKNVLRQTDREIAEIDKQIKKEIDDGIISTDRRRRIY